MQSIKRIEEVLSSAGDLSRSIAGNEIMLISDKVHAQAITIQCVPNNAGSDYEVAFESGPIDSAGQVAAFGEIATFDQDQGSDPTLIEISQYCRYRFRYKSGSTSVKVVAVP